MAKRVIAVYNATQDEKNSNTQLFVKLLLKFEDLDRIGNIVLKDFLILVTFREKVFNNMMHNPLPSATRIRARKARDLENSNARKY